MGDREPRPGSPGEAVWPLLLVLERQFDRLLAPDGHPVVVPCLSLTTFPSRMSMAGINCIAGQIPSAAGHLPRPIFRDATGPEKVLVTYAGAEFPSVACGRRNQPSIGWVTRIAVHEVSVATVAEPIPPHVGAYYPGRQCFDRPWKKSQAPGVSLLGRLKQELHAPGRSPETAESTLSGDSASSTRPVRSSQRSCAHPGRISPARWCKSWGRSTLRAGICSLWSAHNTLRALPPL